MVFLGAAFRGEVVVQVVVQLDPVEPGILGQLQAFPQVHPVRVGKGPEVDGFLHIEFDEPQRAITPGQAVVFYIDDEIVGGGIIETESPVVSVV